jgi:hypothetical protein
MDKPSPRATGVCWPETRWRSVSAATRVARRLFLLATISTIVMLATAAIALNVRTDGAGMRDFMIGLVVPIGVGVPAAAIIAEMRRRWPDRTGGAQAASSRPAAPMTTATAVGGRNHQVNPDRSPVPVAAQQQKARSPRPKEL